MRYYYTIRKVKRRGKSDGRDWRWEPFFPFRKTKEPDPPIHQEMSCMYEKELLQAAEENLSRIAQEWAQIDEKLHENCENAEVRYKRTESTHKKELEEHKDIIEKYKEAKEEFYNQPIPHLSKVWYLLLLVIITFAEIAFNIIVFDVFGQSKVDTIIMALGVMIAIPSLSHFIGTKLKMEGSSKTTTALVIIATFFVTLGLVVIALLREKFLEANQVAETLGITWSPEGKVWTFLIINILLFVTVVVLAYEAGFKNPDEYNKAKRAFKEASKKLSEESGDVKRAGEELVQAKIEFNRAHFQRENRFEKIKYKAEEEKKIWARLVQSYRASNMYARRDKTTPESFKKEPKELIPIPETLCALDCKNCYYPVVEEGTVKKE